MTELNLIDLEKDTLYFYDLEVFQNFVSGTFINASTGDKKVFVVFEDRDDRKALKEFIEKTPNLVLVGFNSLGYDNIMLNFFLEAINCPLKTKTGEAGLFFKLAYKLSQEIIEGQKGNLSENVKKYKWAKTSYKTLDLMTIRPGATFTSLKQIAIALKWHRVQDLPLPYDAVIKAEDVDNILDYNNNDVEISRELYNYLIEQDEIQLRLEVSKLYNVNITNKDRSAIANALMNKFYADYTNTEYKDFKDLRTERKEIKLIECIPPEIEFKHPTLKTLLKELKEMVLTKKWSQKDKAWKFGFNKKIQLNGVIYDMGVGGLHSKDQPGILETDSKAFLVDADVTSFYPFIMLNRKVKPQHCDEKFYDILRMIVNERVKAKSKAKKFKLVVKALESKIDEIKLKIRQYRKIDSSSEKLRKLELSKLKLDKSINHFKKEQKLANISQEALKIVINSIFGKLGSDYNWTKDEQAMITVTISGQLYLLSLIDRFIDHKIEVVSANTDGIVCRVKNEQKNIYDSICFEWESFSKFQLEKTYYQRYIRKDVNNYMTVKTDGELKVKGCFEDSINLFKGYSHPIVATALKKYFLEGIKPEDTIKSCKNIYEFCKSQKVRSDYGTKFFTDLGGKYEELDLQKNNRYFVSISGGNIYKRKYEGGGNKSLEKGEVVVIANDIDESRSIESYPIKYQYYFDKAWDVIDTIQPAQQDIFSLLA